VPLNYVFRVRNGKRNEFHGENLCPCRCCGCAPLLWLFQPLSSGNCFLSQLTGALPTIGPDSGRVFAIERNGEEIGRHEVTVEQRGRRLEVRIKVTVDYRFLFISVYRFEHDAHEIWKDGTLQELRAITNDNGESFDVLVWPQASGLLLNVNGEEHGVGRGAVPSSLWCQDLHDQGK
jgi:hypothetical protein